MASPKPKPTRLRVVEGNPSRRPIKDEPDYPPASAVAEPPLELVGEEREEWDRVLPALQGTRVITAPDLGTLALYCVAFGRVRRVHRAMKKRKFVIDGGGGIDPLERLLQQWAAAAIKYGAEFGLTPSSRVRLGIERPKDEDALGKYLGE